MRCASIALVLATALGAVEIIEPVEAGEHSGWLTTIDVSGRAESGNTNKQEYQVGLKGLWDRQEEAWLGLASVQRSWSNDVMDGDARFVHLRYLRPLSDRVLPLLGELYGQYQSSETKAISRRELIGGNIRLRISEGIDRAYLGMGMMEVYELKRGEEATYTTRANLYATLHHQIDKKFFLYGASYWQPSFEDESDYELIAEGKASYRLSSLVELSYKIRQSYDSTPAVGKTQSDLAQIAVLSFHF